MDLKRCRERRMSVESLENRCLLAADLLFFDELAPTPQQAKLSSSLFENVASFNPNAAEQAFIKSTGWKSVPLKSSTGFDSEDAMIVIDATAAGDANQLEADLKRLGLEQAASSGSIVSGWLPVSVISAASELSTLKFIRESSMISNAGAVTSQADRSINADLIRSQFDLTGEGLSIGIISDSFDTGLTGSYAEDILSGDLPGIGNPNGFTTPVNVIEDAAGGSDEGRAMAQIIYDIAPGAELHFATAAGGQANFADNIQDLIDAGVDIIVDEVQYPHEPFFQDGIVAQAVDNAADEGILYFAAAGNHADTSYEAPVNPSAATLDGDNLHDFGGGDTAQLVTLPLGSAATLTLQWDQPFGAATSDLDLYLCIAGTAACADSRDANIGNDPLEFLQFTNTGFDFDGDGVFDTQFEVRITHADGPVPTLMKYVEFGQVMTIDEFNTASGTIVGHYNAAGAISLAAVDYSNTFAFGDLAPAPQDYSSHGGVDILFDTLGNPLAVPQARISPDFAAPDDGNTTFFGRDEDDADAFPNFPGTSAAAPVAAAMAALMMEQNSISSPKQIYDAMADTALDIGAAGFDDVTGSGLVDFPAALNAIGGPKSIVVNSFADVADSNPGNGQVETGVTNRVTLRAAIQEAIAASNETTVFLPSEALNSAGVFGAGDYTLTQGGSGAAHQGDFDISGNDVAVAGLSAESTTIDANGIDRLFDVYSGSRLTVSNLKLTGGGPNSASGGAIFARTGSKLDVSGSILTENVATYSGGAIINYGDATIRDTAIVDNTATYGGGGVYNYRNLDVFDSVFAGNTLSNSSSRGGGIRNANSNSTLDIKNSVLANNTAAGNNDVYALSPINTLGYNLFESDVNGVTSGQNNDLESVNVDFVVTSLRDFSDPSLGNGQVDTTVPGEYSLRAAVQEANIISGTQTIAVRPGEIELTIDGNGNAVNGDLEVSGSLTVIGAGPGRTTVDANGIDRHFQVNVNATLDLSRLTLTGGAASGSGGSIFANATSTVELSDVILAENTATASGGGLATYGNATLINTAIVDNAAVYGGGGIYNYRNLDVVDSVLTGNSLSGSSSRGGGIRNANTASTLDIQRSVVANNSAAAANDVYALSPVNSLGDNVFSSDVNGISTGQNNDAENVFSTFVVTSLRDLADTNFGNGQLDAPAPGEYSLRMAIQEANDIAGTQTILVRTGTQEWTLPIGSTATPLIFTSNTFEIDLLAIRIANGEQASELDWNNDGTVNINDHVYFIEDVLLTHQGDANLDGSVTGDDFDLMVMGSSRWTTGDFDGNQTVNFTDFLLFSGNIGQ